jgi:bacterioferritin-associated ferredoxin
MKLSSVTIRKMMNSVKTTRDQELTCGHCYEELDQFIEKQLAGKRAEEAMPLVQEHLDRCAGCREEYEVLLEAIQTMID